MSYLDRLNHLQQSLKAHSIEAFLVEDTTNLFYLTGIEMSAGKLLVTAKSSLLIVDNRYFEICKMKAPCPVFLSDKEPLSHIFLNPEYNYIKALGIDSETTYHKNFTEMETLFHNLKEQTSGRCNIKLVPLENLVKNFRMIKDSNEIASLKKAGVLGSLGFDYVCSLLKLGITEIEVARELEIFWKKNGGKSIAFEPIIAFGSNTSMPHYRSGEKKLEMGDPVLIDIGVNYQNYQSDMTRMAYFGTPPEQISIIYPIVERAQKLAIEICKPGTLIKDIDAKAREFIAEQGYGENFTHGIGHGVGLEVHELPNMRYQSHLSSLKLVPGMVITVEPGIYLPKVGGVRIEDTLLITKEGNESLTNRSTDPVIIT